MNALTLMHEEHVQVKKLLEEGESTTERGVKTRTELFARLKEMLTTHERMEEEVFYPALLAHPKARELTLEGYQEHHVVDLVFEELEATPVDDETWGAKFSVAKENIEHHIEEEESDMFAAARKVFDPDELVKMGERMAEIRSLAQQVESGAV
ncbi:MAG: hemerythrin domain-containing protein [Chloroflexota bacterium]